MTPLNLTAMAAAMLGMSIPLAAGVLAGNVPAGVIAALGSLCVSTKPGPGGWGYWFTELLLTLIAGNFGILAGTVSAAGVPGGWLIPLMAFAAALIGGISYTMARSSLLFVLFMVIATGFPPGDSVVGLMGVFSLGAVWAKGLFVVFTGIVGALAKQKTRDIRDQARLKVPLGMLVKRWRWSLGYWAGWQYPCRIALCLLAAQILGSQWAGHRSYWIGLTIVIVVRRELRTALGRTLERALGTIFGVLAVSLVFQKISLTGVPPVWTVIAMVAVLGGLRPVLLSSNYTAYAAVMTSLVILLLEFGGPVSQAVVQVVVLDRLVATLAGCAISLVIGYAGWSRIPPLPDFPKTMRNRLLRRNRPVH